MMAWHLWNMTTGEFVKLGDAVTTSRGETWYVTALEPPKTLGSSGYIIVADSTHGVRRHWYPGAVNCKFLEIDIPTTGEQP
jgi:hypothetical protein